MHDITKSCTYQFIPFLQIFMLHHFKGTAQKGKQCTVVYEFVSKENAKKSKLKIVNSVIYLSTYLHEGIDEH